MQIVTIKAPLVGYYEDGGVRYVRLDAGEGATALVPEKLVVGLEGEPDQPAAPPEEPTSGAA